MPDDSAGRARVRLLEDFCDNSFIPPAGLVLLSWASPKRERDQERLRRYQSELSRVLLRLEVLLEGKQFLGGSSRSPTPPSLHAPSSSGQLGVELDPRLHNVPAWIARLRERPSVRALGY